MDKVDDGATISGGNTALHDVFAIDDAGAELLSHLGPIDLSSLRCCSRRCRDEVRRRIVLLCRIHLPIECRCRDWTLTLSEGASYPSRESLIDFGFRKMMRWGYELVDGGSFSEKKEWIGERASWSDWCRGPRGREEVAFSYLADVHSLHAIEFMFGRNKMNYSFRDIDENEVEKLDTIKEWSRFLICSNMDAGVGRWSWSLTNKDPKEGECTSERGLIMFAEPDADFEVKFVSYKPSSSL